MRAPRKRVVSKHYKVFVVAFACGSLSWPQPSCHFLISFHMYCFSPISGIPRKLIFYGHSYFGPIIKRMCKKSFLEKNYEIRFSFFYSGGRKRSSPLFLLTFFFLCPLLFTHFENTQEADLLGVLIF